MAIYFGLGVVCYIIVMALIFLNEKKDEEINVTFEGIIWSAVGIILWPLFLIMLIGFYLKEKWDEPLFSFKPGEWFKDNEDKKTKED